MKRRNLFKGAIALFAAIVAAPAIAALPKSTAFPKRAAKLAEWANVNSAYDNMTLLADFNANRYALRATTDDIWEEVEFEELLDSRPQLQAMLCPDTQVMAAYSSERLPGERLRELSAAPTIDYRNGKRQLRLEDARTSPILRGFSA